MKTPCHCTMDVELRVRADPLIRKLGLTYSGILEKAVIELLGKQSKIKSRAKRA